MANVLENANVFRGNGVERAAPAADAITREITSIIRTEITLSSLSSVFTPPPDCTLTVGRPDITASQTTALLTEGLVMYNYDHIDETSLQIYHSSCWPPNFTDLWPVVGAAPAPAEAYPGGYCPDRFTSACQATFGSETQVWCCSRGYSCRPESTSQRWCQRNFTSPTFMWAAAGTGPTYLQIGLGTVSASAPHAALAKPIPIALTGFLAASDKPPSPSQTTSTSSSTPDPTPDAGLSAGGKAGIGVGVSLFVILLLALGFLLFRRRRKRAARQDSMAPPAYTANDTKPELDGSAVAVTREPQELDSTAVAPPPGWQSGSREETPAAPPATTPAVTPSLPPSNGVSVSRKPVPQSASPPLQAVER